MSFASSHFTPDQARLDQLMSDLSEDYWCAGWLIGLEQDLWEQLKTNDQPVDPDAEFFGFGSEDSRRRLEEIGEAAARCDGWIVWKEGAGETFVTFEEWGQILGLNGPAQLPERFRQAARYAQDPRSKLLEGLSRAQLSDLVMASNFCFDHLQKRVEGGGTAGCLHCGVLEHSRALSEIDCTITNPRPDEHGNRATMFDLDCDPKGVVERVKRYLEEDAYPRY